MAIPVGYDQPGVAARIAHHGVGEFIDMADLTADALQARVRTVLGHARYRATAGRFRDALARIDGPQRAPTSSSRRSHGCGPPRDDAVDRCRQAWRRRSPVLRPDQAS